MKNKILATLAVAGIALVSTSANAQEIAWDTSIGLESEYVFRGIEIASESVQASIDGSYGDAYFGIWTNEAIEDEDRLTSEYDLYAGYGYAINEDFTADFGATVYYYPDVNVGDDDTFEVYTGITAVNFAGAPSLYAYYDFDLETLTLEASASKSYDLNEKSAIEFGAALGWVDMDAGGNYGYYNVSADYVYSIKENMSANIGIRAGGNDEHLGLNGKDDNLWGGMSFNASF